MVRQHRSKNIRPDGSSVSQRDTNISLKDQVLVQCTSFFCFLPSFGEDLFGWTELVPTLAEVTICFFEEYLDAADVGSHAVAG